VDGRTLVPVRGVFEELGFEVDWYQPTQTATLTSSNYTVIISIGSPNFTTNGGSLPLDVPAQIIGGRTMLPIRAVVESVGYYVDWDGATSTVIISSTPIGGGQAEVVTPPPVAGIVTDLTNPANYWIEIDGVRIAPGMTVSQLLATGIVQTRDPEALDTMMGSFGTAIYSFSIHDGTIWRHVMTTTIRNTSRDAVPLSDGKVGQISIDNFQASRFDDVVFINDIRIGVTTRAEIISMFGEPDVASDLSIQYRPFFDNRDRNRSLMFAGYTFRFMDGDDILTSVSMDFSDFEQ